jgi:hypothetical protein
MSTTHASESEITIFARLLENGSGRLTEDLAHYFLHIGFNERDKARMHELAVRNQEDALTPAEREELIAFGKVGDLLSILKSKARRTLGMKLRPGLDLRG